MTRVEKMGDHGAYTRAFGVPRGFEETTTEALWTSGLMVRDGEHGLFDICICERLTEVNLLLHG